MERISWRGHKVATIGKRENHVDKTGNSIALLMERDGRQIYVAIRLS